MTSATPTGGTRFKRRSLIMILTGFIAILLIMVVAGSLLSGYGLNLRGFGRAVISTAKAVIDHKAVIQSNGDFRNIIFLHHSVGARLIDEGGVRDLFTKAAYDFWDHDYNWPGLRDPLGRMVGFSYNVPQDNTDPDGLATIFTQPVYSLPLNTFSALMQHEVIAFKSCFPASNIQSDGELDQRKTYYLKIRDVIDQHPDKLFILITQPPLNPGETTPAAATRAREFVKWVMSDGYLAGHPNIAAYDLYTLLAENDPSMPDYNMLRADYRAGTDSHPVKAANEKIGPEFVDFVIKAIERFRAEHL